VSIFSVFGKKGRQPAPADTDPARKKRSASATPVKERTSTRTGVRTQPAVRDRDLQAARATALKIDAIESEMSSEFIKPATTPAKSATAKPAATSAAKKELPPLEFTRPAPAELTSATDFLMNGSTTVHAALPESDAADAIEEAAIMFANNQGDVVEQILRNAIADDLPGRSTMQAWWMLFDLYRIAGKQQAFEDLSIEYLNKFETSPPSWTGSNQSATPAQAAGATPLVAFTGKLDAAAVKLVERIQRLAEQHRALRLEFLRVTEADPAGCGLLLGVLQKLHKSGHELILVGAAELVDKIKAIAKSGVRGDTEPAWLLLLELLRLLNRETEFEERSIDYCITFEVSPPAFVAPGKKIISASSELRLDTAPTSLALPAVVEGNVESIIAALHARLAEGNVGTVDCSALARIEFQAAGKLLSGIAPLCGPGKTVEFHQVNHLVAALFQVIGLSELVRVFPAKY
jgi:ABC-type transporter Mla MlaB component